MDFMNFRLFESFSNSFLFLKMSSNTDLMVSFFMSISNTTDSFDSNVAGVVGVDVMLGIGEEGGGGDG